MPMELGSTAQRSQRRRTPFIPPPTDIAAWGFMLPEDVFMDAQPRRHGQAEPGRTASPPAPLVFAMPPKPEARRPTASEGVARRATPSHGVPRQPTPMALPPPAHVPSAAWLAACTVGRVVHRSRSALTLVVCVTLLANCQTEPFTVASLLPVACLLLCATVCYQQAYADASKRTHAAAKAVAAAAAARAGGTPLASPLLTSLIEDSQAVVRTSLYNPRKGGESRWAELRRFGRAVFFCGADKQTLATSPALAAATSTSSSIAAATGTRGTSAAAAGSGGLGGGPAAIGLPNLDDPLGAALRRHERSDERTGSDALAVPPEAADGLLNEVCSALGPALSHAPACARCTRSDVLARARMYTRSLGHVYASTMSRDCAHARSQVLSLSEAHQWLAAGAALRRLDATIRVHVSDERIAAMQAGLHAHSEIASAIQTVRTRYNECLQVTTPPYPRSLKPN